MSLKILHVIPDISPETGGPVTAVKELCSTQDKLGHEACILSTDYGIEKNLSQSNEILVSCTSKTWRFSIKMYQVMFEKITWSDVVHIHTMWEYPTLLAIHIARKINKPFILRPCGMLDNWSMKQSNFKKKMYLKFFGKKIFKNPCLIHFTSLAEQKKSLIPFQTKSFVLENGVSENALKLNKKFFFFDVLPSARNKEIILFLGRIHFKKRPDIAIKAFAKIANEFPNCILVLAGPCSSNYKKELNKYVEKTGLNHRIYFTGILNRKTVLSAFRAATLFLLPSYQENFGIAVAEAMANSCPVIISENVDIKDYIKDGKAGLVCNLNEDSFASAIRYSLSNLDKIEIMGKNGKKVVEKNFKWETIAKKIDKVYFKIPQK